MAQLSYNPIRSAMPLLLGLICFAPMAALAQSLPALPPEDPTLPFFNNRDSAVSTNTVSRDYASSSYLLGPGDRIEVRVYSFPEYTGPMSVLPDGTIILPIVGKVMAAGKTTDQLTQDLTRVLNTILVDPAVSVSLNALRPVVINVAGEVYRPGPLQLQGATDVTGAAAYSPPYISEALVQAGGIRRTADIRQVVVIRELPNGNTVRTNVNLWDALWSATVPEEMLLRDGDLVFVPRLPEGEELVDNRLLATSSLAPDTVRVRVVGEVTRPGEVAVPPNSSLSSAVAIAGGPTDDARLKEVVFVRMDDTTGEVMQEVVDLRNLVDTYQIQDGDVVVVPKTTSGSVLDLAARIVNPLNFLFRIFNF
ncbi:polysaccharide biosynthesis/export family protein [Leptothoe sp. PORK10 BA2]|uniref:polysaccharide biosynthesis/export family protein n=1 Tax=Leptothoe sp. PORK10 BA2 TaxID=3110254 RepID=UPI002B1F2432|nr:polysaccharide biosynthesis/export family protein [Leptothoe sp. PORK10 BA2]